MKIVAYSIGFIAVLVLGFALFVRVAPTDPARWHQSVQATSDTDLVGGAIRVRDADPEALAKIDAAARDLPRTRTIAGSVEERRITYMTRSALWGFPDYTTVEYADGTLRAYARLRFGRSDLGVNARRLDTLLRAIEG
ncbi:MAG: DUF1499 domain-containing protein [Pseudomonadota bacterium]